MGVLKTTMLLFFPQKTVFVTATLSATVLLFLKSFCLFVFAIDYANINHSFLKENARLAKVESSGQSFPLGLIASTVQSEFHSSTESWVSFPS